MPSRQFGHRRIDQCADPSGRDCASCRRRIALSDWQEIGHKIPLLVNLQPAGEYLGEDYYRAGACLPWSRN
jgi:hypothetical protein